MLRRTLTLLVAVVATISIIGTPKVSHAVITDSGNQFIDDNTGLVWMDIDTYYSAGDLGFSYNEISAMAAGAGFHIATTSELLTLQS